MPNELARDPQTPETPNAPEAEAGPSREEILAALRQEQGARMAAEETARQIYSEANRQPQQPVADPYEKYAAEGIALSADQQRNLLDQGTRLRAREEAARMGTEVDRRAQAREARMMSDLAMEAVKMQHPELSDPKNVPKFAAAMVEADFEARQNGMTYTPMQLAQRAAQKWKAANAPAAPTPAYVEGAGNPGIPSGAVPGEPEGPNFLEDIYGAEPGSIKPMTRHGIPDEYHKGVLKSDNERMFKRGVLSNMAGVNQTVKGP